MKCNVEKFIGFYTNSEDELNQVRGGIHEKLVGMKEYIDSDIVLTSRESETIDGYEIVIYVAKDLSYEMRSKINDIVIGVVESTED